MFQHLIQLVTTCFFATKVLPTIIYENASNLSIISILDLSVSFTLHFIIYLRAVGVGSGVGHGEKASFGVLQFEVLIGELSYRKRKRK